MITEEALPTYMAMLNTLDGVRRRGGCRVHTWRVVEASSRLAGPAVLDRMLSVSQA